jgi:4,4'-diaponeurosporenoate glycosyltransferase
MRPWQVLELALLLIPGFLLLWRVRPLAPAAAPGQRLPSFAVVVPARNEEARLPQLLESLARQTRRPDELIVVDDGSTDRTVPVALAAGARVLTAGERPDGWLGKSWACWQGARAARADLLLFLDADTRLEPAGCERILGERAARGGVVTVQPRHLTGSWAERFSSIFNIIVMAAINAFTAFGDRLSPAGCFGPCILCGREEYFTVGGHEAVRASILEDLDLGRRFLGAGIPVHCRGGAGVISFRMYPGGLPQMVEGWSKNMARGAQGTHPLVLACIVLWIAGSLSAAFFCVRWCVAGTAAPALEAAMFYLLYAAELSWMLARTGNFGPLSALAYPAHFAFFMFVFARSLVLTHLVGSVTWKGRRIPRPTGGARRS